MNSFDTYREDIFFALVVLVFAFTDPLRWRLGTHPSAYAWATSLTKGVDLNIAMMERFEKKDRVGFPVQH